jgi:hypothetical protein
MDLFLPNSWVWKDFEVQEENNEAYLFNLKSLEAIYLLGYSAVYSVESQGLFFDPEVRGYTFLWNICCLSTDYTALYPTKWNSSQALLWEPRILHKNSFKSLFILALSIKLILNICVESCKFVWRTHSITLCKVHTVR